MSEITPSLTRTALNVGSSWLNKLVSFAVTVVLTGYATNTFGLETMGLWLIATNFAYYGYLLDVGIASALPRILPRLRAKNDELEVGRVISSTLIFLVGVAILGILITPFVAGFVANGYDYEQVQKDTLYWLIILVLVPVFLSLPFRIGLSLLASVHRFDIYYTVETIASIGRLVLAASLLYLVPSSVYPYGFIVAVAPWITSVIQVVFGWRNFKPSHVAVKNFSASSFRFLLSSSGAALMVTISSAILIQGGTLIAGHSDPASAALFGYPILIVVNIMSLSATFGPILTPVASTLYGKGDAKGMAKVTLQSVRAACVLSIGLVILVVIAGPELLRLWLLGPRVNESSLAVMSNIMIILVFGAALLIPGSVVRGMLMAVDMHWQAAWVDVAGVLIGLILSLASVYFMDIGIYGIAYGVFAAFLLRGLIGLPWLAARVLGVQLKTYLIVCFVQPWIIGLVALGVSFFVRVVADERMGFWSVVLAMIAGYAIWIFGSWLFVIDEIYRKRIRHRIERCWCP